MTNLRVEENCAASLELYERPCGYIVIRSINVGNPRQLFWGEIQIRTESQSVTFRYTIDYLDLVKRYYRFTIFKDREFKLCLAELHIQYVDCSSRTIKVHSSIKNNDELLMIPDELSKLIHIVVYEALIDDTLLDFQFQQPIDNQLSDNKLDTVIGIDDDMSDDFQQETFTPFERLVSDTGRVLNN